MNDNNNDNKIKRIFNVDESVYEKVGADINSDAEMETTVSGILQNDEVPTVQTESNISSIFGVPLDMETPEEVTTEEIGNDVIADNSFNPEEITNATVDDNNLNAILDENVTIPEEMNEVTPVIDDVTPEVAPIEYTNPENMDGNVMPMDTPIENANPASDMAPEVAPIEYTNPVSDMLPGDTSVEYANPISDMTPEVANITPDVAVEPIVSPVVEDIFPSVEDVNPPVEEASPDIAPEIVDALNNQDSYTLDETPQELVVNYQEESGDLPSSLNRDAIVNNYTDNHLDETTPADDNYFNSVDDILENSKDINLYTQQSKAPTESDVSSMTIPTIPVETPPEPQEVPTYTPEPDRFGFNAASTYDDHHDFNSSSQPYENQSGYVTSSPYVTDNNSNNTSHYDYSSQKSTYIPKSEFASRPSSGETNFDKKMRRQTRPINFVLFALYAVCFAIIIFVGYNIYLNSINFYASRSNIKLVLGSSYQETLYKKGELQDNADFIWESTNPKIATVDSNGNISSVSKGNAVITFKNKKTKQGDIINVNVVNLTIETFEANVDEQVIYMGNTFTITPIINGQNSFTIDLIWESTDPSVAEVDKDGIVTPKSKGETQIIISAPDTEFMATVDIKVLDKK